MTTPASGRKLTTACNGVTTAFSCPVFQDNSDLQVFLLNAATDANAAGTLLVEGTDYTVSGSGPDGTATVTTTVAYPLGKYIRRFRTTSRKQEVEFTAGIPVPAATQEGALDRLSLIDEEHDDDVSRALTVPSGALAPTLPAPADMAGKFLGGSADGSEIVALSGTGTDAALRTDLAAPTGSLLIGWILNAVGAVMRTIRDKLSDRVHIKDFFPVGDGVADDATPLINFHNSAIARPGVKHEMDARTYASSQPMPSINIPNVWVEGKGADIKDGLAGEKSGTWIKYIGAAAPAAKLVEIASLSGAANRRVHNVRYRGIGLDANALIGTALSLQSVRSCDITRGAIANATAKTIDLGVVASLAESRSSQNNKIDLKVRQVEAPLGKIVAIGDASANFSMNNVSIDAVHKDAPVLDLSNTDNNTYDFLRTFIVAGGAATENVSLRGGATEPESCRGENFEYVSANLPLHAYGTGTYAVGSTRHYAFLDEANNTPDPIIDEGASINFERNTTATAEQPWSSYVPSVAAQTGALTTVGAKSGFYRQIGKRVEFKVQAAITTNGTGATALNLGLPVAAAGTLGGVVSGRETATGKALSAYIGPGASVASCLFHDGTYPGADGRTLLLSGFYEVA